MLAAGGKLLPNTRVQRLFPSNGGWRVRAEPRVPTTARQTIDIDTQAVFVACGSIQTPALLRRSGIKRNIGDTLHMHPTIKVIARFPEEVNAPDLGVPVYQVKEFAPRFSFGSSISSPAYLALAVAGHPESAQLVSSWRQMSIYYAMIRGGCGSVRNMPYFRDPLVRYRLSSFDLADLAEALQKLCRCLFAAGAVALYPTIWGGPCLRNENDLGKLPEVLAPGQASLMTIHLFSSCPMGEDLSRCAVDSFGQVHGIKNLYVVDGSVLPGAPGVNPQGSIMAIARRNTLRFLRNL
jgi:choline dehydrogenase-like flavoprotein